MYFLQITPVLEYLERFGLRTCLFQSLKLLGNHISSLTIGTVLVRLCINSVKVGTDIIKIVTEFFESRGRIKTQNGYLIGQSVLIVGAKKRINQSRDSIRKK